jgi:hypothetical protein
VNIIEKIIPNNYLISFIFLTAKYSLKKINENSLFIRHGHLPLSACKKVESSIVNAYNLMWRKKIKFKKLSLDKFIFMDFLNNCKLEINNF